MDLTWFLMIKYLISFDETTKFGFGITFKKESQYDWKLRLTYSTSKRNFFIDFLSNSSVVAGRRGRVADQRIIEWIQK